VEDFDREIYGRVPRNVPKVVWEVTGTTTDTSAGVAGRHQAALGHVDKLFVSAAERGHPVDADDAGKSDGAPVPVMLDFGFNLPPGIRPPGPADGGPTWQEQLIAKGNGAMPR